MKVVFKSFLMFQLCFSYVSRPAVIGQLGSSGEVTLAVVDRVFELLSRHLVHYRHKVLISGFVFTGWVFCSLVSVSSLDVWRA